MLAKKSASSRDILRVVPRDGDDAPRAAADLVKFGQIVRSETATALKRQVASEIGDLKATLGRSLARTEAAFRRGELADAQTALDALQARTQTVSRMVSRLMGGPAATHEHRLVNVNSVVSEALDVLGMRADGDRTVSRRLAPALPPMLGNATLLRQAVVTILAAVEQLRTGEAPVVLSVETAVTGAVLSGESVVRIQITTTNVDPDLVEGMGRGSDAGLYLTSRIVAEHGGVLSPVQQDDSAGFRFEFPAV